MREIKFRGKRIDNGEWVYGSLYRGISPHERQPYSIILTDEKYDAEGHLPKDIALGFHSDEVFVVEANSVGQFTGLTDKNGKEIYEGDIIASEGYSQARHYIRYLEDEVMFIAMIIGSPLQEWCVIRQAWIDKFEKKVIGNIHDNPELINKIKEE